MDVSDFSWFEDARFDFVQCDMDKRENIQEAAAKLEPGFDIILDDASHASHHQQFGLLEMWPLLKPGGMYIIEDLHWQPRTYEPKVFTKTGDLFQLFQHRRTFEHSDAEMERDLNELVPEIGFAYVFPNGFRKRGAQKVLVLQKEY
ncbi:class I SAM-dependent methyltransferase [Ruegeria sp. Ofav3-42]|uniref:class I SAM-dependent methyltransferase n=1 Tax=Ruegeria sp. Ofav3-42 TaxID=2917759 RepID=UPI001EF7486B|nr:class I SAM-dependent methyltransferase [Ruegeria sp. Ofav3-42]MCG7518455.1 class I SAM-dependent methyltransferase [Ruegeria sp. Ofav3-42]